MEKPNEHEFLTFEQVKATFAEFQDDSDRAAAILSVALLDAQLEEILTAFGTAENSLAGVLKPDQPIGSLGARHRLCLGLGLISADESVSSVFSEGFATSSRTSSTVSHSMSTQSPAGCKTCKCRSASSRELGSRADLDL